MWANLVRIRVREKYQGCLTRSSVPQRGEPAQPALPNTEEAPPVIAPSVTTTFAQIYLGYAMSQLYIDYYGWDYSG